MRLKTKLIKQDFAAVTEVVAATAKAVNGQAERIEQQAKLIRMLAALSERGEVLNRGFLGRLTWLALGK